MNLSFKSNFIENSKKRIWSIVNLLFYLKSILNILDILEEAGNDASNYLTRR